MSKNLSQWLIDIEKAHPALIALGLERVQAVAERAGLLPLKTPAVLIAGTNGKGSTLACLAALLQKGGMRVGTYTSPHLLQFVERVQLNGRFCSESAWIDAFETIQSYQLDTPLTFFEFTTLAALALFQQNQDRLDIVLLEIGLGGRLDAVNIVTPQLTILTSIGFDHQAWLGETLDDIAREKAGILRPTVPVVLAQGAQNPVIHARIAEWGCPVIAPQRVPSFPHDLPQASLENAAGAYQALSAQFSLPPLANVLSALVNKALMGRRQSILVGSQPIVVDVAHNEDSAQQLASHISNRGLKNVLAVWSSLADKDLKAIVAPLQDKVSAWYVAPIAHERAASVASLTTALTDNIIYTFNNLKAAIKAALTQSEVDCIIIYGSFFTVAEALDYFRWPVESLQNYGLVDKAWVGEYQANKEQSVWH